ncbi:MAG: hypothetical protein ABS35_24760 [Kaistia sp. SCN 65-12]|nr:MAG: hypothetical protein ABS35_24760 [Kaistia sp. SCN 65-12]
MFGDGGFWEVRISGINVRSRAAAVAYRALVARLRTGEDILLPVRDLYQPVGSRLKTAVVTLSANAPLRSTQVALTVAGVDVEVGHHITLGDRLYLVSEVVSGPTDPPALNQLVSDSAWSDALPWTDAVSGASAYTLKILPPLRADLVAGEPGRFRDLLVRCVLKDPNDGDLDLDLGRFGSPSMTFIESL